MEHEPIAKIRKRRLEALIKKVGSVRKLADLAHVGESYIRQLRMPDKSFAETAARRLETAAFQPKGWLDTDEDIVAQPSEWPFSFDKALWDRLPPSKKGEVEAALLQIILGASVQEAALATSVKARKHKG